MKIIITETQNRRLQVLRRITSADWDLILEIVDEGLDNDDPCDFRNYESYLKRILHDSSRTYLNHYFLEEEEKSEDYKILFEYLCHLIYVRLWEDIKTYYEDKKEDC